MEVVAQHLQHEATIRISEPSERDLFGRSAFNRYYYATFLITRSMFSNLNVDWTEVPHATYPELLQGKIRKRLVDGRRKANKVGDYELAKACNQAISAVRSLSEIMQLGFATRVTADYNPEIPVIFLKTSGFKLNSVLISDAHQWPSRARVLTATIEDAWIQINV